MKHFFRELLCIVVISIQPISVVGTSSSNVIIDVDVDKGIALQHIRIYAEKLEESGDLLFLELAIAHQTLETTLNHLCWRQVRNLSQYILKGFF